MIDDSALFHAGTYDPAKARAYYLRTRKLKGRKSGVAVAPKSSGRGFTEAQLRAAKAKSRRAELEAQKLALEKRLDRLRDVLKKLVEEAKKRSDKNAPKKPKQDEKGKAPETRADKADRNADEKSRKPLTAAAKAKKAKAAKEAYEKENPSSLSEDIEILREQVKDIQEKVQKALADAAERKKKANKPAALSTTAKRP
jgi:hypothetical protein